jgi:hypothetical protein
LRRLSCSLHEKLWSIQRCIKVLNNEQRIPLRGFEGNQEFSTECAPLYNEELKACALGKNINVIVYFVYLLYCRACFWVFIRDDMTLRI